MGTRPNEIKSTKTALRIIEAIEENGGMGVTALSRSLDIPKSTVYSHLNTLTNEQYVVRDGEEYAVGYRFLEIGEAVRDDSLLYTIAEPELEELAAETGEMVNLMVEEFGKGVYVDQFRGDNAVQLDTHPGKRVDLHCTGLGKAILAHLPEERLDEILADQELDAKTENTITDEDELRTVLEEVRERGFAYDDEERAAGLRCVAAPVTNGDGVSGAISVSGPLPRMRGDRYREEIPDHLVNAASVIEINMTYS